jgi:elongation factor P
MTTITYADLRKGVQIIIGDEPYEIIEAAPMFKARGSSVLQVKLKNLITQKIISKTFHSSDIFEQAEILKTKIKFIFSHRDKFTFSEIENPSKRIEISKEKIGSIANFLKANQIVETLVFKEKIIGISLPIKIELEVVEAPPGIKGNRAQSGNKIVVLETGAEINVPLFIEQGDVIEINTEKKEYVRRIEKTQKT